MDEARSTGSANGEDDVEIGTSVEEILRMYDHKRFGGEDTEI